MNMDEMFANAANECLEQWVCVEEEIVNMVDELKANLEATLSIVKNYNSETGLDEETRKEFSRSFDYMFDLTLQINRALSYSQMGYILCGISEFELE